VLNRHGDTDEVLMRYLRYFVRTNNEREVNRVVRVFEEISPEAPVDPQIYAEAAGYLLDTGRIVGIRDMLFKAFNQDPMVPEVHYELARYNIITNTSGEARAALDNAITAFFRAEPLSQRRLRKQIDTYILSGEYWYEQDELLNAQSDFDMALRTYEEAKSAAFLAPEEELARVYARLGDIHYYHGRDYNRALSRFNSAVADGYETDEINYKRGYVHYRNENYDRATDLFFSIGSISEIFGLNNNIMYARANALYNRGNYVAAEALYAELLDRLTQQRSRIRTLLVEEDDSHRALVENLVRVHNNLGVTRYRIGETASGSSNENPRLSDALASLQMSTELSGNYLRDYETGQRALATDLAFLNIREILYPDTGGFEPQIYVELPRDPEQGLW
jgi:tetratricopeptide (TPR) repeat protein